MYILLFFIYITIIICKLFVPYTCMTIKIYIYIYIFFSTVELSQWSGKHIVSTPPAPSNGCPIYVVLGKSDMRTHWMTDTTPHKNGTNPGSTPTRNQVWICDTCHSQINGRKQILIKCNRIEHWVHIRCPYFRPAQYIHIPVLAIYTMNPDSQHPQSQHHQTLPGPGPRPTHSSTNTTTQSKPNPLTTYPTHLPSHPEPNTYPIHALH